VSKRTKWQRLAVRLLCIVAAIYVGLLLVFAALQNQIIFPGAASQGHPDALVRASDDVEIVELKVSTGDKVVGLFGRAHAEDAALRPTLLYFYGNGMCMANCVDDLAEFRRRGFNVMAADYIGYGMSSGKPSEAGVYATADAAFDHLLTRSDVDKTKIVPIGWSLGAAAAIHLGSTRNVPCVVVVSAFTSMDAMARRLFPYLPTRAIRRHHFDNESKLRGMKLPLLVAHGTRDSIIPFGMSDKLAQAAAGPVTKYDVHDGDHNDVFDVGGTALLDAITQFINEHAGD
jgi:pimeloyl-ACP methyl ester carboxylesterase